MEVILHCCYPWEWEGEMKSDLHLRPDVAHKLRGLVFGGSYPTVFTTDVGTYLPPVLH